MNRIHIIGRKNSGKTTLIVELVEYLTCQGMKVGTIKHTHHHHELDTPGKDSHRHRIAGASAVGILSPQMNAVFWPQDNLTDPETEKYTQFDALMSDCDLVLVEGDSSTTATKIEVFRAASGQSSIAANDPTIHAVVTDDPLETKLPVWPRNDLESIARRLSEMTK